MLVTVEFDINNVSYKIERGRKMRTKTEKTSKFEVYEDIAYIIEAHSYKYTVKPIEYNKLVIVDDDLNKYEIIIKKIK